MTNVVKPAGITLVKLVCCVGADPSLADTLFAEELVKILRQNGHRLSSKPDPVILCITKVNSNYIDF
jgi:hypothetical protein